MTSDPVDLPIASVAIGSFTAVAVGGYLLAQVGGIWSAAGWLIVGFFVLAILGTLTNLPRQSVTNPVQPDSINETDLAELDRLGRSANVTQRSNRMLEAAELLTVSSIRAGMEDLFSWYGSTPSKPLSPGQASRGALACFLLFEGQKARGPAREDAIFLHKVSSDFMESAATPEIALRFLRYIDWNEVASENVTLDQWLTLFRECSPYNRAAGDTTSSAEGSELLQTLFDEFRAPWPTRTVADTNARRPRARSAAPVSKYRGEE